MCIQVVSSGRGLRHNTRDCFSKARRKRGVIPETVFQRVYKVGDYVDVVCDPAQQKGMPFKFYHGKTGRVWNVTKRALGVEMNKQVGGRIMKKRLHVRIEHVRRRAAHQLPRGGSPYEPARERLDSQRRLDARA